MPPLPKTPVTRPLGVAALATVILSAASLLLGIVEATAVQSHRMVVGVGSTVLLCGYAIILAALARGLWLGRRWSRGPAVALQILHIAVGWSFWGGSTSWVAVSVIGLALVVIVVVLLPSSTAVLVGDRDS